MRSSASSVRENKTCRNLLKNRINNSKKEGKILVPYGVETGSSFWQKMTKLRDIARCIQNERKIVL